MRIAPPSVNGAMRSAALHLLRPTSYFATKRKRALVVRIARSMLKYVNDHRSFAKWRSRRG